MSWGARTASEAPVHAPSIDLPDVQQHIRQVAGLLMNLGMQVHNLNRGCRGSQVQAWSGSASASRDMQSYGAEAAAACMHGLRGQAHLVRCAGPRQQPIGSFGQGLWRNVQNLVLQGAVDELHLQLQRGHLRQGGCSGLGKRGSSCRAAVHGWSYKGGLWECWFPYEDKKND